MQINSFNLHIHINIDHGSPTNEVKLTNYHRSWDEALSMVRYDESCFYHYFF